MEKCPVCGIKAGLEHKPSNDFYKVFCDRCGIFSITHEAKLELQKQPFEKRQRANFSNWLSNNEHSEIFSKDLTSLLSLTSPAFIERANNLLKFIAKKTNDNLGWSVKITPKWISQSSSVNERELLVIVEYLEKLERIDKNQHSYKILPNGWIQLEELSKINVDSTQAFVAMWFNEDMDSIYEDVISSAIVEAGYEPLRIDKQQHNNKICDEIIAKIRKSKFLVADLTGHRGGVYYEAGFAKGLGLEVFWSCNEKDFDSLHFDIRQYNCIKWNHKNLNNFKVELTNRIESVLGHGTYNK